MGLAIKRRKLKARLEHKSSARPLLLILLGVAALGATAMAVGLGTVMAFYLQYSEGYAPIEEHLRDRYVGATLVYDRGGPNDGIFLGTLSNPHAKLMTPIHLEDVSPYMIEATVSTEDNSFWTNRGFNAPGLIRAAKENLTGGVGSGSGGSSITQQLVKNVYLSDDCEVIDGAVVCVAPRTIDRKLREIVYATQLDNDYTKEEILSWYLNQISYADRYVGVEAAARGYFRKAAKDLTLAEAAVLAGIPAGPTAYHPRLNCVTGNDGACIVDEQGRTTLGGAAKERQEHVLRLMAEHGRAKPEEVEAALGETVYIWPATEAKRSISWIENQVEPRLVRMCEAGMLPKTPGATTCLESVQNGGYRVTSTLDYPQTLQATLMMGEYVSNGLANGCNCHNAAIATIDPKSGQVIIYAPNIDQSNADDPLVAGNIDQLMEVNQPGSSFKPAVYLAWFASLNKTPMSSIWDTSPMDLIERPATPEEQVTIRNPRPGGGGEGLITARGGLGGSQNVPAFRAAHEAGLDNVILMAKKLGITTLGQRFDPTFNMHDNVIYGPSIATGGANIRAIDMAYMNATIANMGVMVGVPTLAKTVPVEEFLSLWTSQGEEWDKAMQQKLDFTRGHIRLPDTRELDPVTILRVEAMDGHVLYEHGADLETRQTVEPAYVWMLNSIMSDCTARFIIWRCGGSNDDLALDFFVNGVKVPAGIKTGTQQGPLKASDTLETWTNGYSRYAATALWVGNADNSLVNDASFAAANTTVRLYKNWMAKYHARLQEAGVFSEPAGFDELKPANVAYTRFQSATTERGKRGGCRQFVETWVRTDVPSVGDCVNGRMPLPEFKPDLALKLARRYGIPVSGATGNFDFEPTPEPTATPSATPAPAPEPTQPRQPPGRPQPTATPEPTLEPTPAPEPTATPVPDTSGTGGGDSSGSGTSDVDGTSTGSTTGGST